MLQFKPIRKATLIKKDEILRKVCCVRSELLRCTLKDLSTSLYGTISEGIIRGRLNNFLLILYMYVFEFSVIYIYISLYLNMKSRATQILLLFSSINCMTLTAGIEGNLWLWAIYFQNVYLLLQPVYCLQYTTVT